jgi:hypothetical protein
MRKTHWEDQDIEPNPDAHQVVTQGTKGEIKESRNQDSLKSRKRIWDGRDDWIKTNFEVQERVVMKLQYLKSLGKIHRYKTFVSAALEVAVDREIAKAEKEGY